MVLLRWVWRVSACLTISALISLFLFPGSEGELRFWGQNPDYISEVGGRVLSDSREIGGGVKVFTVQIIYAENQNKLRTDARGTISVFSSLNVYKGEQIIIRKRNLLYRNRKFLFLNRSQIEIDEWENTLQGEIFRRRADILKILSSRMKVVSPESFSFFTALVFGIRDNPDGEIYSDLRRSGASHILALSGLHLGIIAFGVVIILKIFFSRKISFILTLIVIFAYVFLVGFSPSLTRAFILFGLAGMVGIIGKRADIFHILVLSFLLQTVIFPESAQTLSFQLSYLALGGIILWSSGISLPLPGIIPAGIRSIFAASAAAQIATGALVVYSFGRIYPIGIISGVVFIPLITLFIWVGIIGLFPLPLILRELVSWLLMKTYLIIKISAGFFSTFPSLSFRGSLIAASVIFGIYLLKSMQKGKNIDSVSF